MIHTKQAYYYIKVLVFLMIFGSGTYGMAQCPTVNTPTPTICDASGYSFGDLSSFVTDLGNGIVWYDAATGGTAYANNELVQEGTYYAGDTTGTCGTRDSVTVDFVVDPSGQNLDGIFCSNENPTVQSYIDEVLTPNVPPGGTVYVYEDFNLTVLAVSTDLLNVTDIYYIVFEDAGGCESQIEIGNIATFPSPDDPAPPNPQDLCADGSPTIADLDPGTSDPFFWYDNIDVNGNPVIPALDPTTPLIDGNTYYVQADDFFCKSNAIPVLVTINIPPEPGTSASLDYCDDSLPPADFDLFALLTGSPATTGTWSGPLTTTNGHIGTVNISGVSTGVYVFNYTVPSTGACPDGTSSVTITVHEEFLSGTPSAANPASYCESTVPSAFDLFSLLDGEDPGGLWTLGTSSADPAVTSPIDLSGFSAGTYDFTYSQNLSPNPCPENATTVQIIVLPDPNAGLAINAVFCENDLAANSPFNLFDALDGSQDNNSGTWTDIDGNVVSTNINITTFTVAGSPYTYTYTIDNGSCIDTESITITIEDPSEAGTATPFEVCEEDVASNSPVDLFTQLTGNDAGGTWTDDDATGALSGSNVDLTLLAPNSYNFTYTVLGIGSCADDTETVVITINPQPITGTPTSFIVCENDAAANSPLDLFGQLTGNDAGGTWSDDNGTGALSGSNVDLTVLAVGSYGFTYSVTSSNGCFNSSTVIITIEDPSEAGTATPFEVCEEDAASNSPLDLFTQLTGNDAGGTWSDDDATGALSGSNVDLTLLGPNSYNFTYSVLGIGSCADDTETVVITINPQPITGIPTSFIVCEDDAAANSPLDLFGQLTGHDVGGTWSDDNGTGALSGSNVDLTILAVGSYGFTYSITSSDGCSNSSTVIITIEDPSEAGTATPFEVCEEDAASNSPLDLFTQLTGNDAGGTWSDDDATGALSGSNVDLTLLAPNSYNFTYSVLGIGSCADDTETVVITISPQPITGTATAYIVCEDDAAAVSPLDLFGQLTGNDVGGTWSDDNGTGALSGSNVDLTILAVGSYGFTYSITSSNGCSNSSTVIITIEDPSEAGTATPFAVCLQDAADNSPLDLFSQLTGNDAGGTWADDDASGALSGSNVDLTLLTTNTAYNFTYSVIGIGSCSDDTEIVVVMVNETLTPTAAATQDFCDSATVAELSATGTAIQWYDDATGGSPLADTTDLVDGENYFATQTDPVTGCESPVRFEVIVTINITPVSGNPTGSPIDVCSDNTNVDLDAGLDGTQDAGGTWIDTDSTGALIGNIFDATGIAPGTYDFTYYVAGIPPCADASTIVTVSVEDPVNAGADAVLDICDDTGTQDLFALLGTADNGGSWSPTLASGTDIFDPLVDMEGTYTYTISNACSSASSDVVITVTAAPDAGTDSTVAFCVGDGEVNLISQLGGLPDDTGTWSPALASGTNTFDPAIDSAGVYSYTVLATSPCTTDVSAQVTVTISDSSAPTVLQSQLVFCSVDTPIVADLDAAVSGTNIVWYEDDTSTTPLDSNETLIDGEDYYATQTDGSGCESSSRVMVEVTVNDAATPTLSNALLELCINDGPTVQLLNDSINEYDSNTNNIVWYDSAMGGNTVSSGSLIEGNTTYYASLIDSVNGCESSLRLEVTPDLTSCGTVVFPDGFSPNNDGVNETYDVDNLGFLYPNFVMEIFNRYGSLVYKGGAITPRFDGKSNQSRLLSKGDLPVGVYFYIVKFNDGTTKPVQGRLYLNR